MDDFVRVASVGDVPAGGCMLVEVGDERILLSQLDGEFFAIDEVCTHAEGPLSEGSVEGDQVECPHHGGLFNLKTGENTGPPAALDLQRFSVRVEGDDILVGPPA